MVHCRGSCRGRILCWSAIIRFDRVLGDCWHRIRRRHCVVHPAVESGCNRRANAHLLTGHSDCHCVLWCTVVGHVVDGSFAGLPLSGLTVCWAIVGTAYVGGIAWYIRRLSVHRFADRMPISSLVTLIVTAFYGALSWVMSWTDPLLVCHYPV